MSRDIFAKQKEELSVNIPSTITEDDDFLYVDALAIKATKIPRFYGTLILPEDELQKAAPTFIGKPLLKDHNSSVDSVIGDVLSAEFKNGAVFVKARVIKSGNEKLVSLIKKGIVKKLSAGFSRVLEKVGEGEYLAKDIQFEELSLVVEPAISDASFLKSNSQEEPMPQDREKLEALTRENEQLKAELSRLKEEKEELQKRVEVLQKEIENLKKLAELGKAYREKLEKDAEKFIKLVDGESSPLLSLIPKATTEELQKLVDSYREKAKDKLKPSAQSGLEVKPEEKDIDKLSYQELKELEEKLLNGGK